MISDIKACSVVACHFSLSYRLERLSATAQLNIMGGFDSFSALTSSSFPSLPDFGAAATADALTCADVRFTDRPHSVPKASHIGPEVYLNVRE